MYAYVCVIFGEQKHSVDLTEEAIATNRDALLGILAWLVSMLGLEAGKVLPRMPRALYRAVLQVLVPAESALRRLIVFAAQGLTVTLEPSSPRAVSQEHGRRRGRVSPPVFALFDPVHRTRRPRHSMARPRAEPRLSVFDHYGHLVCSSTAPRPKPKPPKPEPDGLINPKRLCRRLEALQRALQDIPRQAKRLARWRARQEKTQPSTPTSKPLSPLREGPPPGYRKKRQHEVDDILAECHDLARLALAPDTS
jgi:hypothetical protein